MIDALLKGKLSTRQENMEDVLTSCVFGAFKHVDVAISLVPFLSEAKSVDRIGAPLDAQNWAKVVYEFWPWWPDDALANCEPDVLIHVDRNDRKPLLILLEVKFRSGKSSVADEDSDAIADQLAIQWAHLVQLAKKSNAEALLYYVTADALMPAEELRAAQQDYELRTSPENRTPFRCQWISWRSLYRLFAQSKSPILADVGALADKLGLKEFYGIRNTIADHSHQWRYLSGYRWHLTTPTNWKWGYRR